LAANVKVSQLYPHDLPDLFKGETLTVFRPLLGGGPGAVADRPLDGERREFVSDVKFVKEGCESRIHSRLWADAARRLADEIRLRGRVIELRKRS